MASYKICQGGSLSDELEGRTRSMQQEVERASAAELADPAYAETLRSKVPEPIALLETDRTQELTEIDMMVQSLRGTMAVRGERMSVTVPVTGAVDLLRLRPTQWFGGRHFPCTVETTFRSKGRPNRDTIVWTYEESTVDPNRFNSWWTEEVNAMKQQIGFVNTDIERFASFWPGQVEIAIATRTARLADQDRRRQALGA